MGQRALVTELRARVDKVRDTLGYPHPRGGPHVLTERDCGKLASRKEGPWVPGQGRVWVRVQMKFAIGGPKAERDEAQLAIGVAILDGVAHLGGQWQDSPAWRLEQDCKRQIPRRVRGVRAAKAREAAKRLEKLLCTVARLHWPC